jgi:hypothetical protein
MAQELDVVVEGRGLLKKAAQVIMAKEKGSLDVVDRKMFDYLLQRAYKNLMDNRVHRIPVQDVLQYLRRSSTVSLRDSLQRLCQASLLIDYVSDTKEERSIFCHWLSVDYSRTEDGYLYYAFDPILINFIFEPKVYAVLSYSSSQIPQREFRSDYAAKLYQIMLLHENRFSPIWKTTPEALREMLGVPDNAYERWDNLRTKVIERAIDEINEFALFDVKVEYVRGGRGGAVKEIRFTTIPKAAPKQIGGYVDNPLGRDKRKHRDPNTLDFFDGKTDQERGDVPVVQPHVMEEAKALVQDDITPYLERWQQEMHGRKVRAPDVAFMTWLSNELEKEKQTRDALLLDLDDDTFGSLLERMD